MLLSSEQAQENELTLGWMREAGMAARLDPIGNCVGRYEGDRPGLLCLMLGLHTPKRILQRLNQDIARTGGLPDVSEKLATQALSRWS